MSLLCKRSFWLCAKNSILFNRYASSVHARKLFKTDEVFNRCTGISQCINNSHRSICISPQLGKVKGNKTKSQKLREVIRPRDAEEVLDLREVEHSLQNCVANLQESYAKEFRLGADLSIFEQMTIEIENDRYLLSEIGQITKPTQRTVVVNMESFPQFIKQAEEVIRSSNMNLNPTTVGTLIKVQIPQVTAEHRKLVASGAKQRLNVCNNDMRKIIMTNEKIMKNHDNIEENLERGIKEQLLIYLDHYIKKTKEIYKAKEKELLIPE